MACQEFGTKLHLVSPSQNISGVTIAGAPLIIAGTNTKVAWGFTNLAEDSSDFYYETLDPKNPERYLVKDRFVDMRVLQQNIRIKGGKDLPIKIRITRHGPIINDLLDDKFAYKENQVIAMRWLPHEHYFSALGIYKLNQAKDINDIEHAAQYHKTPGQNWVYADSKGNIGYTPAVCVPLRKNFQGLLPVDGASGRYEWGPCLPIKKKLGVRNPKQGWVATANQPLPNLHGQKLNPYTPIIPIRLVRIQELLTDKKQLSIKDFQGMQNDTKRLLIYEWKSMLAALPKEELNAMEKEALRQLLNWDGNASSSGEPGATLFFVLRTHLITKIFSHYLNPTQLKLYLEVGRSINAFDRIIKQKESYWFDDPNTEKRETRQDILLQSLRRSVAYLKNEFATDSIEKWDWGKIHYLKFYHILGRSSKLLGWLLNRGPYPMGGAKGTINCGMFQLSNPYQVSLGPSMRYVIDLANIDRSFRILPTGNSGNFMSPYYSDQTQMFLQGKYRPFYLSRKKVIKDVQHRLILAPTEKQVPRLPLE